MDNLSVTFAWTPLPDEASYRLQLASTDAFASLLYDEIVERPATLDLDEVLPDAADMVYWRVRAAEGGRWSHTARFGAPGATDGGEESVVVQAEPVPVTPARDASIEPSPATVAWEGVPEASGYQVQVARSASFEEPVIDLTLDQTASLVLWDQLPEANALYWRVRTLFPDGSAGPWSATVPFSSAGQPAETAAEGTGEAPDPSQAQALAAGPAQHARTGRTMSLIFILVVVLGFLFTIGLAMWAI